MQNQIQLAQAGQQSAHQLCNFVATLFWQFCRAVDDNQPPVTVMDDLRPGSFGSKHLHVTVKGSSNISHNFK